MINEEYEVCGSEKEVSKFTMPLWNYGKRVVKSRDVCKSCVSAHKRGVL